MQLTPHFNRAEFERSDLAARFGIDNTVPDALLPNLQRTAELLEAIRRKVGPVNLTSGYRCIALNLRAGGALQSAHTEARAADINVTGIAPLALATYIRDSGIAFDKCILEFQQWVHVQVERSGEAPRKELLTAVHTAAGTVYTEGLHA